jgi:lysozyme family protein
VTADGAVGPETLKALKACGPATVVTLLKNLRLTFLHAQPDVTDNPGWLPRVERTAALALAMAQTEKAPTMSNIDPTSTDTKSPLQSTTIQGAIISIIGAMAPTLASLLHIDAQQLINVVGAVATIAGFAMTIIGRMKATKLIA